MYFIKNPLEAGFKSESIPWDPRLKCLTLTCLQPVCRVSVCRASFSVTDPGWTFAEVTHLNHIKKCINNGEAALNDCSTPAVCSSSPQLKSNYWTRSLSRSLFYSNTGQIICLSVWSVVLTGCPKSLSQSNVQASAKPGAFIAAEKWLCIVYLHGSVTGMTAAQPLWPERLSHHSGY